MKCKRCSKKAKAGGNICQAHYNLELRQRAEAGELVQGLVHPGVTLDHIEKLQSLGIGIRVIAEQAGLTEPGIRKMFHRKMIRADSADRILSIPVPSVPHELASDGWNVPSIGSARRVQALIAAGWTLVELAKLTGRTNDALGDVLNQRYPHIRTSFAKDIDSVFQKLQMKVPPDTTASRRSRLRGERMGWALPLQWDEERIDNPRAYPRMRQDDLKDIRMKQVRHLQSKGYRNAEIARRIGVDQSTVYLWLREAA